LGTRQVAETSVSPKLIELSAIRPDTGNELVQKWVLPESGQSEIKDKIIAKQTSSRIGQHKTDRQAAW
jgi:hypothetical protein